MAISGHIGLLHITFHGVRPQGQQQPTPPLQRSYSILPEEEKARRLLTHITPAQCHTSPQEWRTTAKPSLARPIPYRSVLQTACFKVCPHHRTPATLISQRAGATRFFWVHMCIHGTSTLRYLHLQLITPGIPSPAYGFIPPRSYCSVSLTASVDVRRENGA